MPEPFTFERFIASGAKAFVNRHEAGRREGADLLPRVVAERLAWLSSASHAGLEEWRSVAVDRHWPALVDLLDGARRPAALDLMAGMAVSVELLCEVLPRRVARDLRNVDAFDRYLVRRKRYARFALVLQGGAATTKRMFVEAADGARHWWLDVPEIDDRLLDGRSHELLVELLARSQRGEIALPDTSLAVTGTLAPDGTVGAVCALNAKRAAWLQTCPDEGLLLCPPPDSLEDWKALFPLGDKTHGRVMAAGSLAEASAKLERWSLLNDRSRPEPLEGWDGAPLAPKSLVSLSPVIEEYGRRRDDCPVPGSHVERACWLLSRARAPACLLLLGPAGAGKSVLAQQVERGFVAGPLGGLGHAVRLQARDLVGRLRAPDVGLAAGLARPADLVECLQRQERLFVVLDGIDDLDDGDVVRVERFLAQNQTRCVFVSRVERTVSGPNPVVDRVRFTSRGERPRSGLLPVVARLNLGPLAVHPRAKAEILALRGRQDLAPLAEPERSEPSCFPAGTPLLLDLAERSIPMGQSQGVDAQALGEAIFRQLLARARASRDGLPNVEREARHVYPGLARRWILANGEPLPAGALEEELTAKGCDFRLAASVERLLESAAALVAQPDRRIDLADPGLAPWGAATSFAEEVERGEGARHELSILAPLLPSARSRKTRLHDETLLFYAPLAREPLPLLRALLDPELVTDARGLAPLFAFAVDFAAHVRWSDPDSAREAWAMLTRARVSEDSGRRLYLTPRQVLAWERFLCEVDEHLPGSEGELLDLLGRPAADALRADPCRIVVACPPHVLRAFRRRLVEGTARERAAILSRMNELGVAADPGVVQGLVLSPREGEGAQDLEAEAYRAALAGRNTLPWAALRKRLLDWPSHLAPVLTDWFGAPAPEESARAMRRDGLGVLLGVLADAAADTDHLLAQAAARPGGAGRVQWLARELRDEPEDNRWSFLYGVLRTAEITGEPVAFRRGDPSWPELTALEKSLTDYARQRVATLDALRALARSEAFEAVAGGIFRCLPLEARQRHLMVELCLDLWLRPGFIPVTDFLQSERSWSPALNAGEAWAPEHEAQWRELARVARGQERFAAMLWCAARDGEDPADALLERLDSGDAELRDCIVDWLDKQTGRLRERRAPLPNSVRGLPLQIRGALGVAGWQDDLVASVAAATPGQVPDDLLSLVARTRCPVPGLVGALVGHVRARPDARLVQALATVAGPGDREAAARLLVVPHGVFPWGELRWLEPEDVAALIRREDRPEWDQRILVEALARMGAAVHTTILAELERARARSSALAQSTPDDWSARDQARRARSWNSTLADAAVRTLDPEAPVAAVVDLAFRVVPGDTQVVYGLPGLLGAEFDEPYDLEYRNEVEGASVLAELVRRIDMRLRGHRGELPALERLLGHPSETLEVAAYERLVHDAPPHEMARLSALALDRHLASAATSWEGDLSGLLLAQVSGPGTGSIDIGSPAARSRLVAAVSSHVTNGHEAFVRDLTRSERPLVRWLAATWIAKVGTPRWTEMLEPLLDDTESGVLGATLRAWSALAPGTLGAALDRCARRRWTRAHHAAMLGWLGGAAGRIEEIGAARAAVCVRSAVDMFFDGTTGQEQRQSHDVALSSHAEEMADSIPRSPPEAPLNIADLVAAVEALDSSGGSALLEDAWFLERFRRFDGPLRVALGRVLVARRAVDAIPEFTDALRASTLDERVVGAEGLVRLGRSDDFDLIDGVWTEAFARHQGEVFFERLASVLSTAPPAFAPLVRHLVHSVERAYADVLPEEGESDIERARLGRMVVCAARWGWPGIRVALEAAGRDERTKWFTGMLLTEFARRAPGFRELLAEKAATDPTPRRWQQELEREDGTTDVRDARAFLRDDVLGTGHSRNSRFDVR